MNISILKLSLIISTAGIFLLLLLSNILEPKLTSIKEINYKFIDRQTKVQGIIFNIKTYKESDFQIISIKDNTGKIDITINKIIDLKNNQTITIIGRVQEYKESLQIQADKIQLVK